MSQEAKKTVELEVEAVEELFRETEAMLIATPVNSSAVEVQLGTLDFQIQNLMEAIRVYMEYCREEGKDLEYQTAVRERSGIRKRRLVIGSNATTLAQSSAPASSGTAAPGQEYRMRLPKRELQTFDGNVRNWRSFWASFTEIDKDPVMPEMEKYLFLLQSMVPNTRPHQIVDSYAKDGPSYKLARDELASTFGRTKTLIKVYMRDLLKLVVDNAKDKKSMDFTEMVTSLTAQTRNLEQLGLTHDKFGVVLYPIVESCIPQEVLTRYLQKPGVNEEITEILEFLNEEVRRRDETDLAQESFGGTGSKTTVRQGFSGKAKPAPPTAVNFVNASSKVDQCGFCGFNHPTIDCRKAKAMSLEDKKEALRRNKLCYKCLQPGHPSFRCTTRVECYHCKKTSHLGLLCYEKDNAKQQSQKDGGNANNGGASSKAGENGNVNVVTKMSNYIKRPEVLLQTLKIRIRNQAEERTIRVMLDSGSQCTYIKEELAKSLNLPHLGKEKVTYQTFGAVMSAEVEHQVYEVEIAGLSAPYNNWFQFTASAIPQVAKEIVSPPTGTWIVETGERGIKLNDTDGKPSDLDMLIGGDISPYLLVGCQSTLLPSNLVARESKLGWFLEGKIKGSEEGRSSKSMMCVNMQLSNVEVSKLWSLDILGIHDAIEKKSRKELEDAAMDHFNNTVTQKDDGRYCVNLPWIEGHPSLPENRSHAVARLHKTTSDLHKDNRLRDYHQIFQSWLEEGIIEEAPTQRDGGPVHYLPHRAVYKENSTTPTRPVFNASSKTKGTVSLNECLETGPNLLERIPSIVTGFRIHKVGVIADIKKAFLQIEVTKSDRDCMRFLWWEDLSRKKIKEYRHCRVMFGASPSLFLLGATLHHLMDTNKKQYSDAVKILRNGFYVDNVAVSLPSLEEGIKFQGDAKELLGLGKFDLRGWEYGPVEEEKIVPVLGLLWNTKMDTLQYDMSRLEKKAEQPLTKRILLMYANSLFDPLGWLSPFTITVKMLFKEACLDKEKFSWDAVLPEKYSQELEKWKSQLSLVSQVQIPRCVGLNSDRKLWSLHCFQDASKRGYSCCVYLRIASNPVKVFLLQARARVTPDKVLTIPRGELLACLIGARLVDQVKKDLGMEEISVIYWTDSTTALTWIRREDTVWGTYVNNRVSEIRPLCKGGEWRHVPGNMNPADLPSRGCQLDKLLAEKWWEGPAWLHGEEASFPYSDPDLDEELINAEKKKTVVSAMVQSPPPHLIDELPKFKEDYIQIVRVVAYMLRMRKRNKPTDDTPDKYKFITVAEMKRAENVVIRHIQQSTWKGAPPTKGFETVVDDDGVVRVKTRLFHGNFDADFKFPALLPGDHPIVNLMVMKHHQMNHHAGVQIVQATIREKFWITHSRRNIRKVIFKCEWCKPQNAKRCQVPEAPLPLNRVQLVKCFQVVGVDLAGPLFLRNGSKVWVCIFTCAVYRAVHLEVVSAPSTAAFINAFRKFVARRGRPSTVYSDNGTNFRGCRNLLSKFNWKLIQKESAVKEIQWVFNPPTASWWGGFWERLIGMMKLVLRRELRKQSLELDELEVLVTEIEAVMNERPLTCLSEDPADLRPLTPAMFLRDIPIAGTPDIDMTAGELNRRYRHLLLLKQQARSRFQYEFLGLIRNSGKSQRVTPISVGSVVLLEMDHRKRLEWPMGIVVKLFPGPDGHVRTARVRTTHGELLRPVQRLFPLEIQADSEIYAAGKQLEKQPEVAVVEEKEVLSDGDEEESIVGEMEPVIVTRTGRKIKTPARFKE